MKVTVWRRGRAFVYSVVTYQSDGQFHRMRLSAKAKICVAVPVRSARIEIEATADDVPLSVEP